MAEFTYKALDSRGQFVSGQLRAPSADSAAKQLIELGYIPLATTLEIDRRPGIWNAFVPQLKVSKRDVTVLLQDLALLL